MRRIAGLTLVGTLLMTAACWAETSLAFMSPKNLKEYAFTLKSKAGKGKTVEYVIRRDVKGIDGPGTAGYLSREGEKTLGTPIKVREESKTLEFRFTVPEDQIATSVFTLWGYGARGEGITFRFNLKDFRP